MLRSVRRLLGWDVQGIDGKAGEVDDLYFNDQPWTVRYLVVDTGSWLLSRKVLVSPEALSGVNWEEKRLEVNLTQEQVQNSPDIELDRPISQQAVLDLHRYYGWAGYWPAAAGRLSGAPYGVPLSVAGAAEAGATELAPEPEETSEWDPHLHSAREVTGYRLHTIDGELGRVADFLLSDENWVIRYIVVDTGSWLSGKKVLIAPDWIKEINWADQEVQVRLSREVIQTAPEYDPDAPIDRTYEQAFYEHYASEPYWPDREDRPE